MRKKGFSWRMGLAAISTLCFLQYSCKKADQTYDQVFLRVTFPTLELRHGQYYRLDHMARSIEILFSEPLDPATVAGNITFADPGGSLGGGYETEVSGTVIWLHFHTDFTLRDGWLYTLTLSDRIRSTTGLSLRVTETYRIHTTARPFGSGAGSPGGDTLPANSLAVISDIHLGDARATEGKYCWFGKNKEPLESFLELIKSGGQIKQLVIQGDLFDAWIIPFTVNPLDPLAGIHDIRDYFNAISQSPVNSVIFEKLRAIASDPGIDLIYIPGNHDMLLSQEVLDSIIPGIQWKGDIAGLGRYHPAEEIIMEHGHRYDFFNCPQPLVNPGHILPPGFFISRMYAYGMVMHPGMPMKGVEAAATGWEFETAWTLSMGYIFIQFSMLPPPMDQPIVLMGGMDGYADPFSFNGARDMYAAGIEDLWMQTQAANGVPVPLSVMAAMWNSLDLTSAAILEYMQQSPHVTSYKVISFGHSHNPFLEVFPDQENYTNIYANSGSWIDADQCKHKVRTFLVITPGAWTGSALDIVRLYQYNLDSNTGLPGAGFIPVLLQEESIVR